MTGGGSVYQTVFKRYEMKYLLTQQQNLPGKLNFTGRSATGLPVIYKKVLAFFAFYDIIPFESMRKEKSL